MAGSPTSLRAVRYVGDGVVDDFRGVYYEPVAVVSIREPVFADVASPLSFATVDGAQRLRLSVSVADQPADAQYAAFVCKTLSPDDGDWTAAADSRAASRSEIASGAIILDLPADSPALFVKLVVSDRTIPAGTKLSELGDRP